MLSYEMLQLPPPHRIEESSAVAALLRPVAALATAHTSRTRRRLAKAVELVLVPGVKAVDATRGAMFCKTLTHELAEAREAAPVCVAVSQEVLVAAKHVAEQIEKRVERNLVELSVATQTPAHLANASLYNFMVAVEGSVKSVIFSLPRDYENSASLAETLQVCVKTQTMICSLLAAAASANPSAIHHFKSAVWPLYQPSSIFDASLETFLK
jgi:hypothetical protein